MNPKNPKKTEKKKIADSAESLEKLQQQIDELTQEKQDLFDKFQRISADYANYQKRIPKQISDSVAYEKKAIIRSLLPCLDNLARAIAGAENAEGTEGIVEGMRLVLQHMLDALKGHGVERIEAIGQQFDPEIHEAVQSRTAENEPDNIVLEEFQNGYKLNGQVIRPSKVIVNKLPSETTVESEPDQTPTNQPHRQEPGSNSTEPDQTPREE